MKDSLGEGLVVCGGARGKLVELGGTFLSGPIDWFGLGDGFGIWAGIPLFLAVAPESDLAESGGRRNRVRFGRERCRCEHGGVWGILGWQGRLLRNGLILGLGIWAGITLFCAVALMRDLAWVDEGCFGVGFGHGERWLEDWGGLVVLF